MNSYTDFAFVYDELMDEIPYKKWLEFILEEFRQNGIKDGLVLDLGCGTGTMTEMLAENGYDMIGVDLSEDMLNEALLKKDESGHDILYLCQDMKDFELYGTVRGIVCVCDSINYLLNPSDVVETFKKVNNYLDPEGIFIFDFNTPYKYREVIGDSVIAENRDNCSFIWENDYDDETGINRYMLTLYIKNETDGFYERCEEEHYQKGYTSEEMMNYLKEAGLVPLKMIDADTGDDIRDSSQRISVVAREFGKVKK